MDDANEPARRELIDAIRGAIASRQVTSLIGAAGLGQGATIRLVADSLSGWTVCLADGYWQTGGYLSGLHELLEQQVAWAEVAAPHLVAEYEQTLKRIWPTRSSSAFRTPKDLTNSTSGEERTRFYHWEYQNKLLVGVAEFLLATLLARGSKILLVVKRACHVSPTVRSLIAILARLKNGFACLRLVLLSDKDTYLDAHALIFRGYSQEDFEQYLDLGGMTRAQREGIYRLSSGNLRTGRALKRCVQEGVGTSGGGSAESVVDFYLATLGTEERAELGLSYLRDAFRGDFIAQRAFEMLSPSVSDAENERLHDSALERFLKGDGPLVLAHALATRDRFGRAELLVEPCEILMGIGLYDTWFEFFASMFVDPALRTHGDGNGPVNRLFINAAFVLYAMGRANVSVRFLEEFLEKFPESRFVPTALYAQSMTYGRYQVPVELERAEAYALRNLALIDCIFRDHDKYVYIKVFAENAYAYIKSRQGHFTEALEYCDSGVAQVLAAYGEERFQLHRSILIYNTSQIYEIVGDLGAAERRLRDAIGCDPYYAEYHNDLGNLLSRMDGRTTEALTAYARAIELSPPYYEAYLNRGVLFLQLGRVTEALVDLERALEIKPEEWRALREIGNARLALGDAAGALDAFILGLGYEGRDADLHANAGLARSSLGDGSGAVMHYHAAIGLQPLHAVARNNLAAELVEQGRVEEALVHARLAAEHGEDPDFRTNLIAIERLHAAAIEVAHLSRG